MAEPYPPQCSGIPLKGWDWSDHPDLYDQEGDTKWGSFAVTGTFDGTTFTVTGAVPAALYDPAAEEPVDFSTPCPEPDGGWHVLDPETTTAETYEQVFDRFGARRLRRRVGGPIRSDPPAAADGPPEQLNDPSLSIVNVKVTGDVTAADSSFGRSGAACSA